MSTLPQAPAKKVAPQPAAKKVAAPPAASKALAKAVQAPRPVAKAVTKPVAKAAVKATVKTVAKPVVKAAKVVAVVETPAKPKKPKLVRDSFTIPKNEYEAIASLKERALKQGVSIKKSELLRAGLMTLAFMPDAAFAKALADVPTLKTGRPASKKAK